LRNQNWGRFGGKVSALRNLKTLEYSGVIFKNLDSGSPKSFLKDLLLESDNSMNDPQVTFLTK
jgi:hypothetical protein